MKLHVGFPRFKGACFTVFPIEIIEELHLTIVSRGQQIWGRMKLKTRMRLNKIQWWKMRKIVGLYISRKGQKSADQLTNLITLFTNNSVLCLKATTHVYPALFSWYLATFQTRLASHVDGRTDRQAGRQTDRQTDPMDGRADRRREVPRPLLSWNWDLRMTNVTQS